MLTSSIFNIFFSNDDSSSEEEEWSFSKPVKGDHIRVKRLGGTYYHHGVYISKNEVIHFNRPDNADEILLDKFNPAGTGMPMYTAPLVNKILSTTLSEFLDGGDVEVKIYTPSDKERLYSVKEIVKRARNAVGSDWGTYDLMTNSCEHFANYCTLGDNYSNQVDKIRKASLA